MSTSSPIGPNSAPWQPTYFVQPYQVPLDPVGDLSAKLDRIIELLEKLTADA